MCGIAGAFGLSDPKLLDRISLEAGRRGPHSWGTVIGPDGQIERGYGALERSGFQASSVRDWWIAISRLSTSSSWQVLEAGQPIEHNGNWLVHNGNILSADVSAYPFPCDSFRIAEECRLTPRSVDSLLASFDDPGAFIVTNGKKAVAVSRGLPLWKLSVPGCVYFCSRPVDSSWERFDRVWLSLTASGWRENHLPK